MSTANKKLSIREKRRKDMQRQRLFTVIGVGLVALLFVGILIAPSIRASLAPVGDIVVPEFSEVPNPDGNTMGDPNAPVTIVEYSDFQCPACKQFHDLTEQQMIDTYVATGKVKFVYRSMAAWIGPESVPAIEAAYCAGDQGEFWKYQKILFANQGQENSGAYSDKRLVAMAEKVGLDMAVFNECFDGRKYRDAVNADRADGTTAGVQGTPGFTINGKLVSGAVPFATLAQEIEAALAAAGQTTP